MWQQSPKYNKEVRGKKTLTVTGETALVTVSFYGSPAPMYAVDSACESPAIQHKLA